MLSKIKIAKHKIKGFLDTYQDVKIIQHQSKMFKREIKLMCKALSKLAQITLEIDVNNIGKKLITLNLMIMIHSSKFNRIQYFMNTIATMSND